MTQPRSTPLAQAATSPVGANPVTRTTKIRDIFIVIIIPFAVPAVVLPVTNGMSSLTLTNLAFGFVGVATAGVARAVTSKTDEWLTYVLAAVTCLIMQTAFAVGNDSSEASDKLTEVVLRETSQPGTPHLAPLRSAALAVTEAHPGTFHWACSALLGATLIALSFELIRRER